MLVFALLMLVLLLAPAVAARARLPEVVGLIAAGTLLGPSVTGVLDRSETITSLGTLGLLYLMFTAGLSLDLQQFTALRQRSLLFGLLSYGIPHALAMAAALLFDMSLLAALLMGAICGTHTLLALPVAQRLGVGRHAAVTVTAGGTLVTDLLGLTVLAAVAAVTQGATGVGFWALFATKMVLFVALVLVLIPRIGRWFLGHVSLQPTSELAFLLLVLFGTSYLATLAGLAPIVGGFLAGLTLNRMVPPASGIMGRVTFVGSALFVPFFLVSVGMLVDVAAFTQGARTWAMTAAFALVIWGGKLAAAWVAGRRLFRARPAEMWLMFGLSTPQAAGTLAVTLVGYELGLFDRSVVNAIVLIIVVTCALGAWVVDRASRVLALDEAAPFQLAAEAPRILIPLANPHTAGELVELAIVLREPEASEPIYPLTIVRDGEDAQEQVARSEQLLGEAVLHAVAAGAPVQPTTRVDLSVVHGIVRTVKELRTSVVVIGWSGETSTGDRIFGGVLDQLLERCPEMVLVCKTVAPVNTVERVLLIVPRHGSRLPGFERAAREAKLLARNVNATLVALADPEDLPRVRERVDALRPALPVVFESLEQPEELDASAVAEVLAPRIAAHDLLYLLGARRDTLVWGPVVARLPARLSSAFPAHTLVVAHPAEATAPGRSGRVPRQTDEPAPQVVVQPVPTGRVRRPQPLDLFVERLLAPELAGSREALRDLVDRLRAGAVHELEPGLVFLHAHAGCWNEARIVVGTHPEPIPVEGLDHPARRVILVISPWGQPPEVHLRSLATVGRAALTLGLERLAQARTVQELEAALKEGGYDPRA